ncbi:MAG: transglycosylase domain-containing protein [Lachnospiraceae bacterium]
MQGNYSRESVYGREQNRRPGRVKKKRKRSRMSQTARITILVIILGILSVLISGVAGAYRSIIDDAPDISSISMTGKGYATFVYDDNGEQIARLVSSDSNRILVTSDMIPTDLKHAFVAIEDERFYKHNGVDIQGILRAIVRGITTGSFDEGASTITQQLIKNSAFENWTNETFAQSVRRKIQEQYLAVQLEKELTKDEILTDYLNIINLGNNCLGVQSASLRYFGKSCSQLTLSEDAVLAAITQNPTRYDPITNPDNNRERQQEVLKKMLEQGYITQDQYDEAIADNPYERIQLTQSESSDDTEVNSYFVDALTDQVLTDLQNVGYTETQAYQMLYSGGLQIYSTQNTAIQEIVDDEVNNEDNYPGGTTWYLDYRLSVEDADGTVHNYDSSDMASWRQEQGLGTSMLFYDTDSANTAAANYKAAMTSDGQTVLGETIDISPEPQISLTLEDQRTGYVVAIAGGRGDKTASRTLNRATQSLRQPGSTFKIVSTYAPALDAAGKTLATTYVDEPYTYSDGTPVRNWYGEAYRGTTTIRTAIRDSMNIIAVKCLTDITPELGYAYLLNFGFTTLVDNEEINGSIYSDVRQTLALGGVTNGVKNIELNAAYATIANGGVYMEPKFYTKITDHDGNVILDNTNQKTRTVLKDSTAYLLTSAMEDVVTSGTGTMCQISETPVAGKTGTTSDENDVWFAGFSNYYTCTTWAGYDENTNLSGSEANIAKIIWQAVMERVHENLDYSDFTQPSDVEQATICTVSGKLAVAGLCDSTSITEYFASDTVPTESCSAAYHQSSEQEEAQESTDTQDSTSSAEQQALDEANQNEQTAAQILSDAQAALDAANATGDANQIANAQAVVDTATNNYNTAVAQVQQAQAALDAANAAAAASTDSGTDTGVTVEDNTGQ